MMEINYNLAKEISPRRVNVKYPFCGVNMNEAESERGAREMCGNC